MASASITTAEQVEFTVAPADEGGAAREIENFEVDLQGADLSFDYDETTKTGHIISGSTTGTFDVIFKADAKLGEGETVITETHQITVNSTEATTLTGTFGAVTPKA
jgi:hypothetical protein